jgi:hypothetical protein
MFDTLGQLTQIAGQAAPGMPYEAGIPPGAYALCQGLPGLPLPRTSRAPLCPRAPLSCPTGGTNGYCANPVQASRWLGVVGEAGGEFRTGAHLELAVDA